MFFFFLQRSLGLDASSARGLKKFELNLLELVHCLVGGAKNGSASTCGWK